MDNAVRKIRREQDITQAGLAEAADTTRQTIIGIEKGRIKEPSYSLMVKISKALGYKVSEIFFVDTVHHEGQISQKYKVG